MKKFCFSLFFSMLMLLVLAQPVHVMSFNIRFNNPGDSLDAWPYRVDKVSSQILFHEVQLIGVQEALKGQLDDLKKALKQFNYIGVGRDDGKEKGEYSAILYDTIRFRLLETKTFWLSQEPTVPGSKSWDAALPRIVTWARFKDQKTKKVFYFFNTHFDHMGKLARKESAQLLLQKVREIAGTKPVLVTGDFNSMPSDEPIQVLTKNEEYRLTDAKSVSKAPHYGPTGTFNAFKQKEQGNEPIDYIFIRNGWKVLKHATLSQSWNGHFSSDHFPVMATVVL